jgi:competence protein ComEA
MNVWKLFSSLIIVFAVFSTTPVYANEQPILNINHAGIEQLEKIKGIGSRKAQAIVEYRLKNGNFSQVSDLVKVKGIGAKFVEKNQAWLSTE